jgi:hypothetical protein
MAEPGDIFHHIPLLMMPGKGRAKDRLHYFVIGQFKTVVKTIDMFFFM